MSKLTKTRRVSKTATPHPAFPLFHHQSGRWCKKVRGKFCYFGKVADDPQGRQALELWLAQKDDLLAIAGLPFWPYAGGHSAEPVLSNTSQPTDLKSSR